MTTLADDAARERIRTDTNSTMFVEAGAGSGKTHSLVQRVLTLVLTDGVPLTRIAAVTFTEKAGAELRDRLRVAFDPSELPTDTGPVDPGPTDTGPVDPGPTDIGPVDPGPIDTGPINIMERDARAVQALDAIDGAAIGTLHSFAQRSSRCTPSRRTCRR